ncbi:MAG TPA: tripartite tricarboxylate transporter substrate binding protein [Casimicrobiaceae bacterium]|nr:tripartite tricarboxylate transporter substrate binding protein [Casimicrobiaceae bacterium]
MAPFHPQRRRFVAGLAAAAPLLLAGRAGAQEWPTKPVRCIVPYPPAGGTDVVFRILSEPMAQDLGQPIVIENKGGAAGNLGTDLAAKAAPDGYTFLFTLSSHTINPKLYDKLPFDVERDFVSIGRAASIPQLIAVHPSVKASTVQELVALAKAQPGKLSFASVGTGSPSHIAGELLKLKTGIDMVHIPYKGGGPAVTDAIGGQVPILFVSMPAAWQHVKSGRLRALAVCSDKRSVVAPELPTLGDAGIADCVVNSWYGAFAPARTPTVALQKLNGAMMKALERADVKEKLLAAGAEAAPSSPGELDAIVRDELKKWEMVIREAKIKPE